MDTTNNPIIIDAGRTRAVPALLSQVLLISSLGFAVSAVGVWLAPALSLVLFLTLTLVMGFEIAPWIQHLLHTGQTSVVFNAAVTTAVGMAVLGLGAQLFRFDYRRAASYAFAALIGLVIVGVISMFFHWISPTAYAYLTLLIFSVLIVVDFMRIRNGGDGATAVELALSIYLDGLNVFLALTRIFSGSRD